jgi:hypothetical protein
MVAGTALMPMGRKSWVPVVAPRWSQGVVNFAHSVVP